MTLGLENQIPDLKSQLPSFDLKSLSQWVRSSALYQINLMLIGQRTLVLDPLCQYSLEPALPAPYIAGMAWVSEDSRFHNFPRNSDHSLEKVEYRARIWIHRKAGLKSIEGIEPEG